MCVGLVMVLAFALLSVLRDLHEQASPSDDINTHA
jgi:hypothetical protein